MNLILQQKEFKWARRLTTDLLEAASESDLSFQLSDSCGPLWKQFRHIGRVHENYLNALDAGKVEFSCEGCTYTSGNNKAELHSYFSYLADTHEKLIQGSNSELKIDWFGEPTDLATHFIRLLTHETLHHGQLILIWRALGHRFPESWADWGE